MKKVKSKKLQIFLFISALGLISIFGWLATVTTNDDTKTSVRYEILTNKKQYQHQQTKCLINNENITCVKWFDKYYIPFDFLSRKFDLQSKQEENGLIRVMFSNSKIYIPPENFDHSDEYLWFSKVNVEPRERVLYMSLKYGVPISSQWNKSGHIYPIQVAQFGLSHWSKWKSKRNSEIRTQKFLVDHKNYFIYNYNNDKNSLKSSLYGFEFNFSERAIYKSNFNFVHISAYITTKSKFHLTIDLKFNPDNTSKIGRITYYFENSTQQRQNESRLIDENNESFKIEFFLTFDFSSRRLKFSRNICVDICKSLRGAKCDPCLTTYKDGESIVRVFQIGVIGKGQIEDGLFYLNESPSLELAQLAADYLVSNQNETTGGWMIHVNRKFDKTLKLSLPNNGWYSSMAQGQAISLLCRMYSTTNNSTYLKSAQNGLNLFDIDVKNGGIRSSFVNRIDNTSLWFEEYPTQPFSLYVLNGFIYTIFGLADYVSLCDDSATTRRILLDSLRSLTTYISHYDTGTRTLYDLRHLSDAELYPNVARWDYHTLHVSQLYYLVDFIKRNSKHFILDDSDEKEISNFQVVLRKVAVRWHNYVYGVWNKESQIKFNSPSEQ